MKYDDKESISNDQSMGSIFHQRCNGVNDCPQTETLSGGEDEEGCEGSGQVRMIMFFFIMMLIMICLIMIMSIMFIITVMPH